MAVASLPVMLPCFWQSRIQAGDLGSHVYNAWLAQLISQGRAPGLEVARQSTNILFDLMLRAFLPLGAGIAQRIAVPVVVLVFVWGAFAFVSTVSGGRAWPMLPLLTMLGYGRVFHMGFLNFQLSLGLCFLAAALAWEWKPRRSWAAVGLLIVAWSAHALPVAWTIALLALVHAARRLTDTGRLALTGVGIVAILAARSALMAAWPARWFGSQILNATGLDQLWIFDDKYAWMMLGLAVLWILAGGTLLFERGFRAVITSVPLQCCILTAVGVAAFPSLVNVPGYKHALAYIAERMGLPLSVCVCALLAAARTRRYQHYLAGAMTLLYLGMLYRDERLLNTFEDRVSAAIAQLPPGQRVVNGIESQDMHVSPLTHMVDRQCVGRCYSYGNYEPSTAQFRVRAVRENGIVLAERRWVEAVEQGRYIVQERDLPLYQVVADDAGQVLVRGLMAGAPSGLTYWNPL